MNREDNVKVFKSRKVIMIHESDMRIGLGTENFRRTWSIDRRLKIKDGYGVLT